MAKNEGSKEKLSKPLFTGVGSGTYNTGLPTQIHIDNPSVTPFEVYLSPGLTELAQTAVDNVQQTGATLLAHKDAFYANASRQSKQSFWLAIITGLIGLILIIIAVVIGLSSDKMVVSVISGVSGIFFELLTAFILPLYKQASSQLATFHQSIDDMHRFIIANSVCELLEGDKKQETRATLVQEIARMSPRQENKQ